jgi:hypothetical protein
MAMKHYYGQFPGRLACAQDWKGGHYFTANHRQQERIERHGFFRQGLIKVIDDEANAQFTERSTDVDLENAKVPNYDVYVKGLSWDQLRSLAKDKGISVFGKKAVDLIEELIKLEE